MESTYKPVLVEVNKANPHDYVGLEFAKASRRTDSSLIGGAPPPSGNEIAALIFKDDPETRSKRFVDTFPRSGPCTVRDRPLWTPMCELTQSSSIFHREPGWSSCFYKDCPGKETQTLFERSEFLIATCKKKKTDRLCVCLS